MKPQGKYFVTAGLLLFLFISTGIAFASSSTFFTQAQKFINQNCNKKFFADQTALLCYLFDKSQEQDTKLAAINATLSPIPSQIASLQASTSALNNTVNNLQSQPGKALKVYDAQDHELGIMMTDVQTVFNTNLNKIISISYNGLAGQPIQAWYTTIDCSGTAYTNQSSFDQSQYIFNIGGVHMEVDTTVPMINTLTINSFMSSDLPPNNHCTDISHQQVPLQERNVLTLKQVNSPYQEPIPLPLIIKYQ